MTISAPASAATIPKMRRGPSGSRNNSAAPSVRITGCTCMTAVAAAMSIVLIAVKNDSVAANRQAERSSCSPRWRVRSKGPSRGARITATTAIIPA